MKKWFVLFVPVFILTGLIVWRFGQKNDESSALSGRRMSGNSMPVSVELESPQIRDIEGIFEATGTVEPIRNIEISPKVAGRVEFLEVREGDRVRQGQVLVRIDQSQVQAEVREQQANLAEAKYRLAQAQLTQNATDTSVISQVSQQKAALDSAEADLIQAEKSRAAQYESADVLVEDAQNKIDNATAAVANANAAINSAQASLENAKAKYERVMDLYKKGFVSKQSVDDAKTALSVQEAALETAKGQLTAATAQLNSSKSQKRSAEQQAKIYKAKADAELAAARAKVTQAKAALDYAKANTKQSSAYRQSLEALKASVAAAQASLDSALARQRDTVLQSPIDGVVTQRNLDPGNLGTAGQPILVGQAVDKVWVSVNVPEDVCVKLRVNQPATVTFDALGGLKVPSRIAQINPSADLESRQFTVKVILDNSEGRFVSGMFAKVALVTEKVSNVLAVPREAVLQDKDSGAYVIVAGKGNKAKHQPVVTGASDSKWIAITSGLDEGCKVVTMSASPVRDGQMLRTGKGPKGRKH